MEFWKTTPVVKYLTIVIFMIFYHYLYLILSTKLKFIIIVYNVLLVINIVFFPHYLIIYLPISN